MAEITKDGARVIVRPGKDLETSMVVSLKNELHQALNDGATEIALDLSETVMMDSMGIGVLIAAHNSLKQNGEQLELLNVSADIMKLLQITRLDKHFKIID